jgi:hypothetical protein
MATLHGALHAVVEVAARQMLQVVALGERLARAGACRAGAVQRDHKTSRIAHGVRRSE